MLIVCSLILILRHHTNIGRLFKGTESKFSLGSGKKKSAEKQ